MTAVSFTNVEKRYTSAADSGGIFGVSFSIPTGQFTTLVGASGSGKTTVLRIIAGFLQPSAGDVSLEGETVADATFSTPTNRRDIAMVFQSYALWPHMSVYNNVAFGLQVRKVPKVDIDRRVTEALQLVDLEGMAGRRPGELSGGQQQRVALARSLVLHPKLLLLDEPLSNLDAELRLQMRDLLKDLQRTTGVTFVYVTHDQEEALALSDHLIVMEAGKVLQAGSPQDIYFRPKNAQVARFIGRGLPIRGRCSNDDGNDVYTVEVLHEKGSLRMHGRARESGAVTVGDQVDLILRSEAVTLYDGGDIGFESGELRGTIVSSSFLGREQRVEVLLESGHNLTLLHPDMRRLDAGAAVRLHYRIDQVVLCPVLEGHDSA